ncbi:MAG: molybdopterin-dependent oxidoreductase, partial [Deltaproteobacteria bacterium]
MPETHTTFCRICESLCGLDITTENNRVTAIHPDYRHVATQGFACPKGMKQHLMYDSPDRVRYPLRRRGTSFERVTWDEAIADIGERVQKLRGDHGADSIAMYVGT